MGHPIFIFIALRGAMDGLDIVIPTGDPEFQVVRGKFPMSGHRDLDGFFSLHSRLDVLYNMAQQGEAKFIHAIGTSQYTGRSHFDGQLVLQSGGNNAFELKDGWLYRLMLEMEVQYTDVIGAAVPEGSKATEGAASFTAYAETIFQMTPQLQEDWEILWKKDVSLANTFEDAVSQNDMTVKLTKAERMAELARLGRNLLYTEFGGFDTHTNQSWPLAGAIDEVDEFIGQLKAAFGDDWNDVVIMAATEFGRTFVPNTALGTDHGTGSCVILAGGALKKWTDLPIVITRWPGLTKEKLFQGRDLMMTTDMRSAMISLTARHFDLEPVRMCASVFPTAVGLQPDELIYGKPITPVPPVPDSQDVLILVRGGREAYKEEYLTMTAKDLAPNTPVIDLG